MLATLTGCSDRTAGKPASNYQRPTQASVDSFVAKIPGLTPAGVRPQVINLPRGRTQIHLGDMQQNVLIARRNADGTQTIGCVNSQEEAKSFLMAAPGNDTNKKVVR